MLSPLRVSDFDRFFDNVFQESARPFLVRRTNGNFSPSIDVREDEQAITLMCDVPGMKAEDLEVSLEKGVLTLKGKRDIEESDAANLYRGRSYGAFARSFSLPESANGEDVSASLADGVLTVRIGKQPKPTPSRIEIQVGKGALPASQA